MVVVAGMLMLRCLESLKILVKLTSWLISDKWSVWLDRVHGA